METFRIYSAGDDPFDGWTGMLEPGEASDRLRVEAEDFGGAMEKMIELYAGSNRKLHPGRYLVVAEEYEVGASAHWRYEAMSYELTEKPPTEPEFEFKPVL